MRPPMSRRRPGPRRAARDGRGRRRRVRRARAAPARARSSARSRWRRSPSVLMWLFWPPVMLVVAGVALAALVWLFAIHGLARSVIQVLGGADPAARGAPRDRARGGRPAHRPDGRALQRRRHDPAPAHLASLRRPRPVGRRRRRLRPLALGAADGEPQRRLPATGRGAAAAASSARASGAEFLFLAAALLTLNMLRLLLPFGRPGADRLLADWLLVQHPLRYAEQALDRYLPGLAASPRPLPPLKRWGRVTIGAYLLAVALVLVVVGLVILRVTPTILATWWVALTAYLAGMAEALGERDVLGFLGSLFNAAVLVLTTFGLVVALIVARARAAGAGLGLGPGDAASAAARRRRHRAAGPPAGGLLDSRPGLRRERPAALAGRHPVPIAEPAFARDDLRPVRRADDRGHVSRRVRRTPDRDDGHRVGRRRRAAPGRGDAVDGLRRQHGRHEQHRHHRARRRNTGREARADRRRDARPCRYRRAAGRAGHATGPASKPTSGTAQDPASKPSTKPTSGTAAQPATKPETAPPRSRPPNRPAAWWCSP